MSWSLASGVGVARLFECGSKYFRALGTWNTEPSINDEEGNPCDAVGLCLGDISFNGVGVAAIVECIAYLDRVETHVTTEFNEVIDMADVSAFDEVGA